MHITVNILHSAVDPDRR